MNFCEILPGKGRHLFIVNDFPPVLGGQSTYLYNLCRALPPEKIIVLAPCCGDTAAFDRAQSFMIIRRPYLFPVPVLEKGLKTALSFLFALLVLLRERIACVHCAHVLSTGLLGPVFRFFFAIPFVTYTHSADVLEYSRFRVTRAVLRWVLHRAHRVMANSRFTARIIEEHGVPAERIVIAYPRLDAGFFIKEADVQDIRRESGFLDRKIILSVNRLIARKGNDVVIQAMPQILQQVPDAVYLILGKGPQEERLKALVKSLGLGQSVIFKHLDNGDIREFFYACDIFVMISREIKEKGDAEGFGLVYLEANACSKPVVAGNSGGVPDAVIDGVNGLLVPPEDVSAVAAAIVRLLRDRGLAEQLGRVGRQRVLDSFDIAGGIPELMFLLNGGT